jgi:hypothetical protein
MNAKHYNGEPEAQHDPNDGTVQPYVCTCCGWTGRGGVAAAEHHINTGHGVRGRRWPKTWPNAVFSGVERRAVKRTA